MEQLVLVYFRFYFVIYSTTFLKFLLCASLSFVTLIFTFHFWLSLDFFHNTLHLNLASKILAFIALFLSFHWCKCFLIILVQMEDIKIAPYGVILWP